MATPLPPLPADAVLEPPDAVGVVPGVDLVDALLEHRVVSEQDVGPVPTGVPELDGPAGGLALGTVTVLVSPPGSRSATRLLLRAALNAAARERPTLFCALDMARESLARALVEAVTADGAEGGPIVGNDGAVRMAAQELRKWPLSVSAGATVSTFDLLAAIQAELIEFVVVDNLDLLLPDGSATDLKHCAIDAHAAVLTSATYNGTEEGVDVGTLSLDVIRAADTIVQCGSRGCQVLVTRV